MRHRTYKTVQCKSTGFGTWDPLCTIKGIAGETYGLCTDKTVGGISGSYFSTENTVTQLCYVCLPVFASACEPLCSVSAVASAVACVSVGVQTYMFETTEDSGFGAGTYLYRGANLDSSIKSCDALCNFIKEVEGDASEIKNLYVGCTELQNNNDEDLTNWWRSGTKFRCSKNGGDGCTLTLRSHVIHYVQYCNNCCGHNTRV